MKAPFAYFGGKMGMAERIVSLMPDHRVYIEPFFGSGAVFFAKPQARIEIINDLDDAVVTFFRVLRERPGPLAEACALTPHSRTEYALADLDDPSLDDLERARRFWVRVNQSFAKAVNQTGWSVTVKRSSSVPATILSRIGRFGQCAERLLSASVENCDAADLITRMATTADTVVYLDPPYRHETRVLRGPSPTDYRHDSSEDLHERLAAAANATPATVILSGYPSEAYDRLYAGWWTCDIEVTAFSSNARTKERTGRIERLWSNRDLLSGPGRLELEGAAS